MSAEWFEWGRGRPADFFLRPLTLTAKNFEALWPTEPKFLALKDLNLLKECIRYQKTSYNFRLSFALSNRPHFNSTYLLRVPFSSGIAVYSTIRNAKEFWTVRQMDTFLKFDNFFHFIFIVERTNEGLNIFYFHFFLSLSCSVHYENKMKKIIKLCSIQNFPSKRWSDLIWP